VQGQGFVRAIAEGGDVSAARWSPAQDELAGVGAAVLGDDDVAEDDDLAERLAAWVPAVAFTHADEGCDVLAGPVRARVGVFRTFAEDPTGAGDCFAAAFFLALARGDDPVSAARLGAAAGSIAVEGRAGTTLARMREAPARAGGITVYQR
jgi:sugar/nucleoside kinase (ribokinase family)